MSLMVTEYLAPTVKQKTFVGNPRGFLTGISATPYNHNLLVFHVRL